MFSCYFSIYVSETDLVLSKTIIIMLINNNIVIFLLSTLSVYTITNIKNRFIVEKIQKKKSKKHL